VTTATAAISDGTIEPALAWATPANELVIEPGRTNAAYWRELWRLREVCAILVWRDVAIRYKQTAIGIAWVVIQPLLTMAVLTVVFGRLARLPSGSIPYPALVLSGMIVWQFFAQGTSTASNSLVVNSTLVSKIYIPRMLIPLAAVGSGLVDLAISTAVLAVVVVALDAPIRATVVLLPLLIVPLVALTAGFGLLLAGINVKYRDVRHAVPFVLQLGLYMSPVGFLTSVVPLFWRPLLYVNPVTGVIDAWRWSLFGDAPAWPPGLVVSAAVTIAIVSLGVHTFRATERGFADII